ncbi:MAG TPA: tetratricopeptide repeat protein [Gammaproteobacteria bacterium]
MKQAYKTVALLVAGILAQAASAGTVPEQAIKDVEAGYCQKALAQIQPLLADHAKDAEVQYRYGQALLGLGKADDAIAAFKTAVALDPNNGLYHSALGGAYGFKTQQGMADGSTGMFAMLGLMKSAKAEWESAAKLKPDDVDAHVSLAMYYIMVPGLMGGSSSKAHDQEAIIEKLDPIQALRVRANEAGHEDEDDEAVGYLQQAVAQDKTSDSLMALGMFYAGAKRYPEAFKTFHEAEAKDPNDHSAWYQIGKTAGIAKANYDEGIASLKQYLALTDLPDTQPSHAWAHFRLGNIYEAQGHKDQAKAEYATAGSLNERADPILIAKLKDAQGRLK